MSSITHKIKKKLVYWLLFDPKHRVRSIFLVMLNMKDVNFCLLNHSDKSFKTKIQQTNKYDRYKNYDTYISYYLYSL